MQLKNDKFRPILWSVSVSELEIKLLWWFFYMHEPSPDHILYKKGILRSLFNVIKLYVTSHVHLKCYIFFQICKEIYRIQNFNKELLKFLLIA